MVSKGSSLVSGSYTKIKDVYEREGFETRDLQRGVVSNLGVHSFIGGSTNSDMRGVHNKSVLFRPTFKKITETRNIGQSVTNH